jgi:hypothetical protein
MLTIETGISLYRPVIVRKPRSDNMVNGSGAASRKDATLRARDGVPTVTWDKALV